MPAGLWIGVFGRGRNTLCNVNSSDLSAPIVLNNRVYVGEAVHKGKTYPGEHEALIELATFERVQEILASNGRQRAASTCRATPALLKGLIFTENGRAMTPTHTRNGSKLYRYYVSTDAIRGAREGRERGSAGAPAADLVETADR
jgi:site-specific DNA recombinase